jgi:integrase
MAAGAPQTMNDEEHAVAIVMIDTGARPSEIINLRRRHIVMDATPAYPRAAGRSRPENSVLPPRRPNDWNLGFPHHRNKGGILSAAVNAHLRPWFARVGHGLGLSGSTFSWSL